jgi:hypothetical protein
MMDHWRRTQRSTLEEGIVQPKRDVEGVISWDFFSWPQYNIIVIP